MTLLFDVAAALALLTTALAITRANPVHALLYFVLSLLCMGVIFFTLGAPFAAALEVIVYAGAIMVLFLFVVMMLAVDQAAIRRERDWIARPIWVFPILLVGALAVELGRSVLQGAGTSRPLSGGPLTVTPQAVGIRLFTTDLAAVELASMLLLAGLIAAFHLGRRDK
jgi:NADH-quinone oxidoreductase subunit J